MAVLFDIVSVQKLDGVRATAALRRCEAGAPSVCLSFAGIAQLEERSPPRRRAERGAGAARCGVFALAARFARQRERGRGWRFDSSCQHQALFVQWQDSALVKRRHRIVTCREHHAPVAQRQEASRSEREQCEFESHSAHQFAPFAKRPRHLAYIQTSGGSSPSGSTTRL
jgi:hypothetical protein